MPQKRPTARDVEASPSLRRDLLSSGSAFGEPVTAPHVAHTWPLGWTVGSIGGDALIGWRCFGRRSKCLCRGIRLFRKHECQTMYFVSRESVRALTVSNGIATATDHRIEHSTTGDRASECRWHRQRSAVFVDGRPQPQSWRPSSLRDGGPF